MSSIRVTDPLTAQALACRGEGHFMTITSAGAVWMYICMGCAPHYPWSNIVPDDWLRVFWWPEPLTHMCSVCDEVGGRRECAP